LDIVNHTQIANVVDMKKVVLFFPYMINLKAFVITEELNNILIHPADSFLRAFLSEDQILKACAVYGAVIV
jgi:hypothetical protein